MVQQNIYSICHSFGPSILGIHSSGPQFSSFVYVPPSSYLVRYFHRKPRNLIYIVIIRCYKPIYLLIILICIYIYIHIYIYTYIIENMVEHILDISNYF